VSVRVETPRPNVTNVCFRCNVRWLDVDAGRVIVSPRGFAHFGRADGTTACYRDATGENWWWPL
jgi:hypothetical protein